MSPSPVEDAAPVDDVELGDAALDDVDLLLLVWREDPAVLARHHAAVAADVGAAWSGRVVLVENAPPPATSAAARREVLERYPRAEVVVLRSPRNLGFARAMDLGLDACRGRCAALLNSDGRPAPGMLAGLVAALEAHPEAVWAAPGVHGEGEPGHPPGPPHPVEELAGTALLVRREAFLASGGFDPQYFFYREDHDASRRLRAAGHVLLRVPDARFTHDRGGRTAAGVFRRELLYARAGQVLAHQHAERPLLVLAGLPARRVRAVAEHVRRRSWPGAAALLLALADLPRGLVVAGRRRRRPWDGGRLAAWLDGARGEVEVVVLRARVDAGPDA